MLNKIIIMGRLTRDPELKRTGTGLAVANFGVAVKRDYPNRDTGAYEVDFINCVAWRQTGEFVSKWFNKGSMIVVSGRLQMRNWTDKDGNKRTTAEVIAENVYFGESKKDKDERNNMNNAGPYTVPQCGNPTTSYGGYYLPFEDNDAVLPF